MQRVIQGIYILIIFMTGTVLADTPPGLGPMHITGQTPLQTLRLNVVPSRHTILADGKLEISLHSTLTNRWNIAERYLLDVEVFQTNVALFTGIDDDAELGIEIPIMRRSGGHLDGFIQRFHDKFGLSQSGRTYFPEDNLNVTYINDFGERVTVMDNNDVGIVIGDISIIWNQVFHQGAGWLKSVMFTGLIRVPTSTDRSFYGSGGIDGAVSFSSAQRLTPFYLYTTIGYGRYGSGRLMDIALKPYQWTFFAALEYPVTRRFSIILQEMTNTGVAADFDDFSDPTYELVLGFKHAISDRLLLEYGVTENIFIFRNSIDFGLNFALSYRP